VPTATNVATRRRRRAQSRELPGAGAVRAITPDIAEYQASELFDEVFGYSIEQALETKGSAQSAE